MSASVLLPQKPWAPLVPIWIVLLLFIPIPKLVAYYPKRDYWLNVLQTVMSRPGFNERLAIDVARLKLETGTLRSAQEYLDFAQLALIEGFPAEAVKTPFVSKKTAAAIPKS